MKYEDIEKIKEIIDAINEIENFLSKIILGTSEVALATANNSYTAPISNIDTIIAIAQALNIRRDELIKEFEAL